MTDVYYSSFSYLLIIKERILNFLMEFYYKKLINNHEDLRNKKKLKYKVIAKYSIQIFFLVPHSISRLANAKLSIPSREFNMRGHHHRPVELSHLMHSEVMKTIDETLTF